MANLPPKIRWAIFVGIALLTLAIRLPRLGERPMHTDEAINAYMTGQLLAGENYHYDPQDRHGPALFFAAFPITKSSGAKSLAQLTERTVRLVPVIWGTLTILLFAAAAGEIGFIAAAISALLFAVSPICVYYNRYFIHETLFVAATLASILSAWRMLERKSWKAAVAVGASAGFMLACKETAVLHFAAFALCFVWWIWKRRSDLTPCGWRGLARCNPSSTVSPDSLRQGEGKIEATLELAQGNRTFQERKTVPPLPKGEGRGEGESSGQLRRVGFCFCVALLTFVVLIVALYTWGGQQWQGPFDLIRSIPRFASRASGEGHAKVFTYYLRLMLLGSGWIIVLMSVTGIVVAFRQNRSGTMPLFAQMLAIYAVMIVLIYSFIPYKTPWLALNFWMPIALLSGVGFDALWRSSLKPAPRFALLALAGLTLGMLSGQTWKWCFVSPADERNPFAYAHTTEDILRLPDRLEKLVAQKQLPADPTITVVMKDAWPLPWYLRGFGKVGFWQPEQKTGRADVYITSPEAAEVLSSELADYRPEFFGVRPEVLILLWTPKPADTP